MERLKNALVVYANHAPFAPGKSIRLGPVQSRMLLWCNAGRGIVTVNGGSYDFQPGDFLFIPWNHDIRYQADEYDPFLLAGIHLIPDYQKSGDPIYSVFHEPNPDDPEYRSRHDVPLAGFTDIFSGRFNNNSPLALLAEYIVLWFRREPRLEHIAGSLARTLIDELDYIRENPTSVTSPLPLTLNKVLQFIDKNIQASISLDDLARQGRCSRPTLFRLFRKHLGGTPGNWLWRRKMEYAADLLTKSNMRIGEVANEIGIDDPYYFSKLFKKYHGKTAREYRIRNSLTSGM